MPCWRQPDSRSAIHAGRQLSVKEFRYLRTVMVAAAVGVSLWAGVRLCTWFDNLSSVLCFWETVAAGDYVPLEKPLMVLGRERIMLSSFNTVQSEA